MSRARSSGVRSLALILAVAVGMAAGATAPGSPRLVVGDSVAGDFRALAEETWAQFLDLFWARRGCFGDVRLEAAYHLDYRAVYDPLSATVTVRVPGTRAMLQSALVHEWAHHIEFQCPAQREMRTAFMAAQGWPADTPWRPQVSNVGQRDDSPSEQYAEAVVEAVLGGRPIPAKATVSPAAVRVVSAWARGD